MGTTNIAVCGGSRVSSVQYAVRRHDNTQMPSLNQWHNSYPDTLLTYGWYLGELVGDKLYISGGIATFKETFRSKNELFLCMPLCPASKFLSS